MSEPTATVSRFKVGDRVRIKVGPLAGRVGTVCPGSWSHVEVDVRGDPDDTVSMFPHEVEMDDRVPLRRGDAGAGDLQGDAVMPDVLPFPETLSPSVTTGRLVIGLAVAETRSKELNRRMFLSEDDDGLTLSDVRPTLPHLEIHQDGRVYFRGMP